MQLAKTLKKDLLELARAHGLDVTARMTKRQIMDVYHSKARKNELLDLARLLGHKVTTRHTKQQLLALCLPAQAALKPPASSGMVSERDKAAAETGTGVRPAPEFRKQAEPDVELPWRYNENRLVLMPVNPNKVYGYWELTAEIEALGQSYKTGDYQPVLNLYAMDGDRAYIVQSVEIGPFGEYYFNHYLADKTVWLELGLKDRHGRGQIPVMYSLKTQMPADHVSDSNEELYLTVLERDSDNPTLVFSGPGALGAKDAADIFLADFESFPRFGY